MGHLYHGELLNSQRVGGRDWMSCKCQRTQRSSADAVTSTTQLLAPKASVSFEATEASWQDGIDDQRDPAALSSPKYQL